jgi:hypothetical protein
MSQENLYDHATLLSPSNAASNSTVRGEHKNDLIVLESMLCQINGTLQSNTTFSIQPSFSLSNTRRPRLQRLIIYRPDDLRLATDIPFVAFVSRRQHEPDPTIVNTIHDIDRELVTTLVDVPGLLAYFSLELYSGQWYNLVVLRDEAAKKQLTSFTLHSYASHEVAPHYYAWIRLHHGRMYGGIQQHHLEVQSTKYYTFSPSSSTKGTGVYATNTI